LSKHEFDQGVGVVMLNKPVFRIDLKSVVTFLVLLCFLSPAVGDEDVEATAKYSKGANQCMACHREGKDPDAHEIFLSPMGISHASKSPFADDSHGCETCHGPSDSHRKKQKDGSRLSVAIAFNETTPASQANEVCLSCHNNNPTLHWIGSMHEEEEVACADCHEVHAVKDPMMDKLAQQDKCFTCHPRTRAETYRASSHPLRFGQMTCSDCHNAHEGDNDSLLIESTVNETCYTCHAEKRGPYLWEHAPVTEDCSLCHNSHGSNHASLLKQRSPLLCQQCHSPGGHPATAYTTDSLENTFQQRFMLVRSCNNCHSQVHGSNHPSGVSNTR
jgi:DmsE family decaheme c-type cytochrome